MNQIKYLFFISTLSIAFPNDGEGYRFIGNSTQDYYIDLDSIFEMSFGSWNFYMNFSGRQTIEFMAPKEKQDAIIYTQAWSKVIATTRFGDKVKPNHDAQKQNGTSYTINIDPITGKQMSIVGNNEASIQMMEEAASSEIGSLFSGEEENILYPFGSDSIRYIGDIWTIEEEGEQTGTIFSFEEFEGTKKSKISYNFKKIKEKGGNKIAYIKLKNIGEISGVGASGDKSIDLTIATVINGDIKFNITTGLMESCKMSMAVTSSGRDLEDDSIKKMSMGLSAKLKQKFK